MLITEVNKIISLNRLMDGGAAILKIEKINHHKERIGV
jgi:hypothetical protein